MAERPIAAVQPDLRAPAFADDLPVPDEVERAALNISRRRATASRTHGAPLRLAFDLDGVLADMESELVRQAESLFGEPMTRRLEERASDGAPATDPPTETPGGSEEQRQASAETAPENVPPLIKLNMTTRQQRRLWKHVESIENFWLTLEELSRMTSYPPASVSAHLRHLRKLQHGGYRVEKRCRASVKLFSPVEEPSATGPVWEYRLERKRASGTENSGSVRDAKPGEAQLASRQGSEFSRYGYRSRNGFSSGGER